jgi:hypothetical protein
MSSEHEPLPSLSTAAESDIVGYSAISPAAIVALLLGVASIFAVGNLLLLIIPALAVVAAGMALLQIARSEGGVSGRWAAIAGLSLALLFASTAVARSITRAWHLRNEARTFANQWLQLVRQGRLEQAHQWHLPPDERQLAGTSLVQYYHDSPTAKEQLDQFFQATPLSRIVAAPSDAQLRYEHVAEQLALDKSDRVALRYMMDNAQPSAASELRFVVVVERTRSDVDSRGEWQIAAVVDPQTERATP